MQWSVPRELLWAIIFTLAVSTAGLVHALKKHPPYAPQINAEQQANGAFKGENDSNDSPDAPAPNKENGGKHADQSYEEGTEFWPPLFGLRLKITDSLLASFTLGLLIFTGLLWGSTEKLWRAGERQLRFLRATSALQSIQTRKSIEIATTAAGAAQSSAEASVEAERARFFIMINSFNIGEILGRFANNSSDAFHMVGRSTHPAIFYSFRNYGKTPGVIKEVSLGTQISSDPVVPVYSVTISSFPEYMLAAGGSTDPIWAAHDFPLDAGQADALRRNVAHLWFFGRVDYEDVFSKPQCHRFYFRTVMWEGKCILQPYDFEHYNQST